MGIFSDVFEPVWSEAIYKAGWEWNSVNDNDWWELPIYRTDWLQSMTYVSLRRTMHVPNVVFARLRNVPYRPEKSDKIVLDFVNPTNPYQTIRYSNDMDHMCVTDMGDLQCKLAHVTKLIKEEWKVPEQCFNYNI